MGAELVGYLVVGPKSFTEQQVQKAIKIVAELKDIAAKISDKLDQGVSIHKIPELEVLLKQYGIDFDDEETLREHFIDFLKDDEPGTIINRFLAFWMSPYSRDTHYRSYGGDRIIIFAGDSSWGDEPSGYGYTALKEIDNLGLFRIFDIE